MQQGLSTGLWSCRCGHVPRIQERAVALDLLQAEELEHWLIPGPV